MLYEIKDGTIFLGGEEILSHFDFEIHGKEKIAIIGSNGTGKTTLCRVLAGELEPETNEKRPDGGVSRSRSFSVGYLRQEAVKHPEWTVEQEKEELIRQILEKKQELYDRETALIERDFRAWFTAFGFRLDDMSRRLSDFSGGQQMRIAMIRQFLLQPEVLILDEPTNHLDEAGCDWLEQKVKDYPGCVVMVSHDRYFLDRTAEVIYECRQKRFDRYVGNYSHYREEKRKRYEREKKAYEAQQEKIAQLEGLIRRFHERPNKAAMTRAKRKELERMPKLPKPDEGAAPVRFPGLAPEYPGPKWIWEADKLAVGYRKEAPVLTCSLRIRRGAKIGVIGVNGSGKTTLVRVMAEKLEPLSGKQLLGNRVSIGYFSQEDERRVSRQNDTGAGTEKTESDIAKSGADGTSQERGVSVLGHYRTQFPALTDKEARQELARFLFAGKDAAKQTSALSHGEWGRLRLAELLKSVPNFLILDEPTNHMDIPARERLEQALKDYQGTLVFVTHDRYFLKEVADQILVVGDGQAILYPMDYEHYRHCTAGAVPGEKVTDQVLRENARLLAEFEAVPKKESHERPVSEEELGTEWELDRLSEVLEQAADTMEETFWDPVYWGTGQEEAARDAWTRACLSWYDAWMDR